jgi:Holliday junction resolvase RusA-like endonuclease
MTMLRWSGKMVGENRRLIPARGRLINSNEYRACKADLIKTFMEQYGSKEPLKKPDVLIFYEVNSRCDHHNFQKPILDALQKAGVIQNDKNVGWVNNAPPERHKMGEPDKLIIMLMGE